jgi:hypothetical protein
VILSKDPALGILGTGHHSVVQVPNTDDWYIAYHRFAIPGGDGTHRETTIDRLDFDADGSIKPVVPTLESIDPVTIATPGRTDSTQLPELVVYDRGAGPIAGVGVIASPAGAYPAKPKLTGLAGFSFGAAYKKAKDTVPIGNATFDFAAGKVKFRSTGSDWLVVTRAEAQYQGSGTVNGTGGYAFRITITDSPDTYRIRIWKRSTGDVVYDNRTGTKAYGIVLG